MTPSASLVLFMTPSPLKSHPHHDGDTLSETCPIHVTISVTCPVHDTLSVTCPVHDTLSMICPLHDTLSEIFPVHDTLSEMETPSVRLVLSMKPSV